MVGAVEAVATEEEVEVMTVMVALDQWWERWWRGRGVVALGTCPNVPRPRGPRTSNRAPLGAVNSSDTATIRSPNSLSWPLREGYGRGDWVGSGLE